MSATIIDSLVVMLGLDSKDLESKSPRATKKLSELEKQGHKTEESVAKISRTSKETARSVEGLTRVVGSFLAVIGGTMAVKAFIADFIDTNAQLDRLSRNLGISVSTISAWSNATQQLGGSAQGLQGTLDMLSKSQTQLMLTGQSSLIPYMSALGISLADAAGKARPVTAILLDLAERFSRMNRTTANNIGRMMGIDQGTLNLLLQGRKELELEIKRQKEQNAVTKVQAEEATKLQRSLVGVKQTFMALGRSLLMTAAPALEKLFATFQRLGNWVQTNREFIADFLKVMAVGLAAIALITMPIDLTVVAVLALGAAIALLWQDYQTWKRGGDSFIDWGKWVKDIQTVMTWIDALIKRIEQLNNWYGKKTGAKLSSQLKSGAAAVLYGVGTALGVKGLRNPGDTGTSEAAKEFRTRKLASAIAKQEGFWSGGKTLNHSQRDHNPGNIEYGEFAKKHGATGRDGRFAVFPNDRVGMDALVALLSSHAYSGLSIDQAITKYAPPSENNTAAYIKSVKQSMGYSQSLAGVPGASGMAASAPQKGTGSTTTIDRSVQTHIGEINIKTQATDAQGIARDMGQSLDYLFASQANTGLN